MESKEWYTSKTILGALVVEGAPLAKLAGSDIPFPADLRAEIVTTLFGLAPILNLFITPKSVAKKQIFGTK